MLAYIRQFEGEQVLCVANLSRFAQPVDLDLSKVEGAVPVEMLGYVEFPTVGRHLYRLTLAPYSFLWLELQRRPEPEDGAAAPEYETPLEITIGWRSVFEGPGLLRLETESLLE